MKTFKYIFFIIVGSLFFSSCVVVDNTPGPRGRDGNAYFGVDYEHHAPYSYWDNNNAIPFNPVLGEYYYSAPGIYNFEYYVNPHEFWHGTYEIWINRGWIGGPHGQPGYNGLDTYLMLIVDPNGYHTHADGYKLNEEKPFVIEKKEGKFNYRITIQKGKKGIKTHQPKYINN